LTPQSTAGRDLFTGRLTFALGGSGHGIREHEEGNLS
jgi:hypothetical protein